MSLLVVVSLIVGAWSKPLLALEVDREDVAEAAPVARHLSATEAAILRFRVAVARVTLAEMDKNAWLMKFAGTAPGAEQTRYSIAVAHAAASGALIAGLGRLARREWAAARTPLTAEESAQLEELRAINAEIRSFTGRALTPAESIELSANAVTPETMQLLFSTNRAEIAKLARFAPAGRLRRLGRGLAVVVVPALVVTLVADLRAVWIHISMNSEELETKRAELVEFIRAATAMMNPPRDPRPKVGATM